MHFQFQCRSNLNFQCFSEAHWCRFLKLNIQPSSFSDDDFNMTNDEASHKIRMKIYRTELDIGLNEKTFMVDPQTIELDNHFSKLNASFQVIKYPQDIKFMDL